MRVWHSCAVKTLQGEGENEDEDEKTCAEEETREKQETFEE